jgi:glucose/arabinose dehydrogenase
MRRWMLRLGSRIALAALVASGWPGGSGAQAQPVLTASEQAAFELVQVVPGLEHPWGMTFLPDGALLITERPGRLRIVRDGVLDPTPISGVPEVFAQGQGGLLDVALDPDFSRTRQLFLSYAGPEGELAGTRVARARYRSETLEELQVIFEARPFAAGSQHFGSRLAFDRYNRLYITLGERGTPERAQNPLDLAGKVVRLLADGAVPARNPFLDRADAVPQVFSYGHRNPQGIAIHPETGEVWVNEHGPRGGDEINIIRAGANHGWPVISHGADYFTGLPIGEGTHKEGMAQPIHYWVPSIAPSGMAFYRGEAFPQWRGDLLVAALGGQSLARLELAGEQVVAEERLLTGAIGRIRDVEIGPDGLVYLLTDATDGALWRLQPAP